jgi:amidohydrolase
MDDLIRKAESMFPYTQALRRDFHQHPELGFEEVRTAGIVAAELNKLGLEVLTGVGKTGVVGLLETDKPGPVLLLRFDMDALPINEATGAEYSSRTPDVMHACGHDGHTAIGLTVAHLLHDSRESLAGTVKLVFQPAEEIVRGARLMIADGVLEAPTVDMALALHLWNYKPVGWFGVAQGPTMAAASTFHLRIEGRGGHGASPHLAADPIMAAAQVISAFQTIVSRNIPPLEPAVVSITQIHAGEGYNVLPAFLEMGGTVRSYSERIHTKLLDRVRAVAQGVAESLGCQIDYQIVASTPAVINDPLLASQVREVVREIYPEGDLDTGYQTMGSEDMAEMMQTIPGCYFFVGSANPEVNLAAPHHHPKFDFDETVLPRAAGLMATIAREMLTRA